MLRAVDFSEYGGDLAADTIEAWKREGVSLAIVQYSKLMRQHLSALAAAEMQAEAYVYLYWGRSPWDQTPADRTRNALEMMRPFGVRRLWLDCEDQTHPFQPEQLAECAHICQEAGGEPGIYTGRWWWNPSTGNSEEFAGLPLWDALYVEPEPTSLGGWQPYGGWTRPAIWQWRGTTTLAGHSVDLNVVAEGLAEGGELSEPERQELEGLRAATARIRGARQPSLERVLVAIARAGAVMAAGDRSLTDLAPVDQEALCWMVAQL